MAIVYLPIAYGESMDGGIHTLISPTAYASREQAEAQKEHFVKECLNQNKILSGAPTLRSVETVVILPIQVVSE